jgi:hypothetical protein
MMRVACKRFFINNSSRSTIFASPKKVVPSARGSGCAVPPGVAALFHVPYVPFIFAASLLAESAEFIAAY